MDIITNKEISIIVAMDENNAIGVNGDLLCYLPNDLKHFKQITSGHCVIMGRRTFESLPKGALPNRTNIIITSDKNKDKYPNCFVASCLKDALQLCPKNQKIFIIGGGQLYKSTIDLCSKLFITHIHHAFEKVDTYFPEIDLSIWKKIECVTYCSDDKHKYAFSFATYKRNEDA